MQHPQGHKFLLKFGPETTEKQRIEVRNSSYELIGSCMAHDHRALAGLIGLRKLDSALAQQISAHPHGQFLTLHP